MRLLLAREWAHVTDPTKFRLDLTSVRSDFEPIKKWSNRAETWQEQSLPHMETTVKIWLHLDLWSRRYARFEIDIFGWLRRSNPLFRTLRFESISARELAVTWRAIFESILTYLRMDRFDSVNYGEHVIQTN